MQKCVVLWTLLHVTLQCPRDRSRVVRKVVQESLEPLYTALDLEVPRDCPFSSYRDKYAIQEANVFEESASKWICQFCGKSFYEPRFLDLHFENRHQDQLKTGEDTTCLADYCDVFRCDVLSGKHQPKYWDVALCHEKDMTDAQDKCKEILKQCSPRDTDPKRIDSLVYGINDTLCDYLTCNRYWEQPVAEVIVKYIVVCI